MIKLFEKGKDNWDYLLVVAAFTILIIQWLSFPIRHVTIEEQTLVSTLLKDFINLVIAGASLVITLAIGIMSFIISKKDFYPDVKKLLSQFYHAVIILLFSVGSGIYNMSHIPFLIIRKNCPNQYEDIYTNESVIIWTLFQLFTFILGLIKLFRGGFIMYEKAKNLK